MQKIVALAILVKHTFNLILLTPNRPAKFRITSNSYESFRKDFVPLNRCFCKKIYNKGIVCKIKLLILQSSQMFFFIVFLEINANITKQSILLKFQFLLIMLENLKKNFLIRRYRWIESVKKIKKIHASKFNASKSKIVRRMARFVMFNFLS